MRIVKGEEKEKGAKTLLKKQLKIPQIYGEIWSGSPTRFNPKDSFTEIHYNKTVKNFLKREF